MKNYKNKMFKRFLAFLLSAAMVITYMPIQVWAVDGAAAEPLTAEQELTDEESAADDQVSEPADESGPEEAQEEAAESETAAEPQTEDTPADVENDGADDVVDQAEPAGGDEFVDAVDGTEQESGTDKSVDADTQDEPEDDIESEDAEEAYPAFQDKKEAGGISVSVDAPEGALPEGAEMVVEEFTDEAAIDTIKAAVPGKAVNAKAVDISFRNKDGETVKPKPDTQVSVKLSADPMEGAAGYAAVHYKDESANVVGTADGPSVEFEANDFSVYALVGFAPETKAAPKRGAEEETGEEPDAVEDEKETWAVTFYNRDGEVHQTINVEKVDGGKAIGTIPEPIAREDYKAYWVVGTIDDHGTTTITGPRVTEETIVTSDLSVVPDYDQITYTVIFHNEDDSVLDTRVVNSNSNYCVNDIPTVPAKAGYTAKWVYGENKDQDFTNTVTITANTDVYPAYDQNVFTVTYKVNGETYNTDTYYSGDTITHPADPVVDGGEFIGWFDGEAEDAAQYEGGESAEADLTLYARFAGMHTVKFINREDGEELVQYFTRTEGQTIGTIPQAPFIEGKKFEKWVLESDPETEVTADTVVTGDINAVAKFQKLEVDTITAEFWYEKDAAHGGGEVVFETQVFDVDSNDIPYTIEAPASTKTDEDHVTDGLVYYPETPTVEVTAEMFTDGKATVRVKYVPFTATYDFVYLLKDLNGNGYSEIVRETKQGVLGSTVTPTVKDFDYAKFERTEAETITDRSGQELEVYYTRKNFTLSYESNGGTYVEGSTVPYGSSIALSSTTPTRTGYTFQGWYSDEALTNRVTGNVTVNADTTLYAKWEGNNVNYTIVYMLEKYDSATSTTSYVYDSSINRTGKVGDTVYASSAPALTGDKVRGYENDTAFNATSSVTITADGSAVLVVHYKLIRYTLVFNINRNSGRISIGGRTYSGNDYQIQDVVIGQSIGDKWPAGSNEIYSSDRNFRYWTGAPSNYVTKQYELHWDLVSRANNNTHVMTFTAEWTTSENYRHAQYWLQQPDGTYKVEEAYTQVGLNTQNLSAKDIAGYTTHSGTPSGYSASGNNQTIRVWMDAFSDTYTDDGGHNNANPGNNQRTVVRNGHTYTFDHAESYTEWFQTRYRYVYVCNEPEGYRDITGYVYNFYYDRAKYQIDYFYGTTRLTTKSNIYYEADISTSEYNYTPSRPAGVDSDYTWGGWYSEAALQNPYTFDKMPGNNLPLYAKWVAPTYTVSFEMNGGTPAAEAQTLSKYERVEKPANPTKAGYTFEGWYDVDGELFDWQKQITENITIYAHWTQNPLSYTVHYVDGEGNKLADDKTVTDPNSVEGDKVTEKAVTVAGYRPDAGSKELTLTLEGNEITFVYSKKSSTTSYTVKYLIEGTEIPVHAEKHVPNPGETLSGDTLSVIEMAAAVDYTTLYAAHPELDGEKYYPIEEEEELVLGADESANVLIFYYSKFKSTKVTVNYVDMDGEPIDEIDTVHKMLKVGETFTLNRAAIPGWELNKAVMGTEYEGSEAGTSYKITENGELVFTIFYQKKITVTAASLSKPYDGTILTMPAAVAGQVKAEGLLDGDRVTDITLSYDENVETSGTDKGRINAGSVKVTPSGAEITGHTNPNYYKVRYIAGNLEVTKVNVVIRIEPDRWTGNVYDGTEKKTGFTNDAKHLFQTGANDDNWYIAISDAKYQEKYGEQIWEGIKSKALGTDGTTGQKVYFKAEKDAGEYTYDVNYNASDLPEDPNYSVNFQIRQGRLQIKPAPVTITTGSASKTYDGDPLVKDEATAEGIVSGETYNLEATGTITEPGSKENTYEMTWASDGNEYTAKESNYTVTEELGTLTVNPASLIVTVKDDSKVYNGSEQKGHPFVADVTGTGSTIENGDYKIEGLGNGDKLTITYTPATGTNVGNNYTGSFAETYTIVNAAGDDVTGNYSNVSFTPGKLEITPATVNVTAEDKTKVYGDADPGLTWKADGLKGADTESVLTVGISRAPGENVGEYTITPTGATTQGNYTVVYKTGTLTITKATATVKAEDKTKVYGDADPALTATVTGLKNGDAESVISYTLSRAQGEDVGPYTITPAGEAVQGNYNVIYETGTLTITKATATVTADNKTKTYGDADPELTATVTGLKNNDAESVISYTLSRAEGEDVGTYTITPTGEAEQGNYNVVYAPGTLTINKAKVTVTADNKTKTYGEADPELTATVTGLKNGDAESVISYTLNRAQGENVGEYKITPAGEAEQGNYDVEYITGKLVITKATVTVTADNKTKTYGDADPELTATVSGLQNGDEESVISYTLSRQEGENVGEYTITPAGDPVQGNYDIQYVTGKLTITKAEVTVTAENKTKTYGDVDPALTATVTGLKNGDNESVISYTLSRAEGENVGTYAITPTGEAVQGNYDVTFVPGTLTITKAALTVTAEDKSKVYGAADPDLTWTVDGLKNGDTKDILTVTIEREEGENVGHYEITPSGAEEIANYTITYEAGDFEITKAALTVTAEDKSKVYGAEDPELTWTVDGLRNGDTKDILTVAISREEGENVGHYEITPSGAAEIANYTIEYVEGDFEITKAALTVTAEDKSKVYGAEDPELTWTVEGLKNGDTKDILTVAIEREEGENVGHYVITPAGAEEIANYTIEYVEGDFEITKAVLTVTAEDKSKVYGAADPDLTWTVDGLKNGDTKDILTVAISREEGENVDHYVITPSGAAEIANYTIEYVEGDFEITKAPLTITAKDQTYTYNGEAQGENNKTYTDASKVTVEGLKGDDALTSITLNGQETDAGEYAGKIKASEAAIGDATDNYEITYVNGKLTINKLAVTVTIVGKNHSDTYDGDEHSVSGYDASFSTDLYSSDDFKFTPADDAVLIDGVISAKRTENGTTYMGLAEDQFANVNDNFGPVTFNVTDGYQEIVPVDEVVVTIVGNFNTTEYDGKEHSVSGYEVTNISNPLYTEDDFEFNGTAAASQTNAGTDYMGLTAEQFTNKNGNFDKVTFNVTDGYQTITPIDVTVTITGHTSTVDYDGAEHSVSGYDVAIGNELYTEDDFTFSGTAAASRTVVGTTNMGLKEEQFANTNQNFATVTFEVTDGYQKIEPINVTVNIVGANNTTDYDGEAHTVTGYTATASTALYDVTKDFTFNGTATATRTDAGTTSMGLAAEQFTNTNTNFAEVTFVITDGFQTVDPIDVTVTITGHTDSKPYDGVAHTVSGYDVSIENKLYKETDFTFNGEATATRTNVVEGTDEDGKTEMGLNAGQFTNTNNNFKTVTFNVTDGYQEITPIDVTVTITGHTDSKPYDGVAHTITGYDVSIGNELYKEADFTFSGEATATRTNVVEGEDSDGQTDMGLTAEQFTNNNANFGTVTFNVTDGYQEITPIDATVTITGHNNTTVYDGTSHTVTGYDVEISTPLYTEADFTFSGTATASRTEEGTTNMELAEDQFANTNTNFATVTFNVTDGYQTITPVDEVVVTITGHNSTDPYDGEAHTVTGYDVSISNPLYKEADFTFTPAEGATLVEGEIAATRTDAGTTNMGLKPEQFANKNSNFAKVTFNVTDGYQKIDPIDVTVTITGHNNTAEYDGEAHTVTGYDVSIGNKLYTESDFTFSGEAEATRTNVVEGEDIDGQTDMGLSADQFKNTNSNFATVTFNVTDGYQKITPVTDEVVVTIVGNNDTATYDGSKHKVTGYEATDNNELYDVTKDVAFSGTDEAERTDVGTTNMNLAASQFTNTNANFANVTFDVTDGYQKIEPAKVTVTIVGNNDTTDYDGKPHTVEDFRVTSDNILYSPVEGTNYTFSGTKTATRTDVGTTNMGLAAEQFTNNNSNFTVTFNVTDGYQKIEPIDVKVTIVGANNTADYDGDAHTVTGYTATANSDLYDVTKDFTFTPAEGATLVDGEIAATRTDAGTTNMGLAAEQFANTNTNFKTVTFEVTDGYQKITPIDAIVTITGHNNTTVYDGEEHTVTDYTATANTDLYDVNSDFTFTPAEGATLVDGVIAAKRTEEGTTNMGLKADQFANTNTNFATVTFNVTDGYQTITPIDEVVVTITGHNSTDPYDGEAHTVTGYDVLISNPLYKETDFTFTPADSATLVDGKIAATRTDAGTTNMGMKPEQFANKNNNFAKVTFNVTDGYQTITPVDITVTITGHNSTDPYDGAAHTVTGYDVSIGNKLYTEADFTFSGEAEATRTNVVEGDDADGQTDMGLSADQFKNTNSNFATVTFSVIDGYQAITPVDDEVTVKITGHNNTSDYNGREHKVSGYDVEISNELYKEADFTFSGTAEAARTDAGQTNMGLAAGQFANNNRNFANVVFDVTDGYQKIEPIDVTVTIVGNNNTADYDGEAHTVTGYKATADSDLYDVTKDFTFSGEATATRTDAGKTPMGFAADQFTNNNRNFSKVTFNVTDGYQTITPAAIKIAADDKMKVYDNDETTDPALTATVTGAPAKGVEPVYTLSREEGQDVGEYAITVTAEADSNPNYTVTVEGGTFTITKADITDDKRFDVSQPADTKYNGKEQKQPVTVKDMVTGKELVEGKDFTLTYSSDVTNAGTVTVTVTGMGNYEGKVSTKYDITKRTVQMTSADAEKFYDGLALAAKTVVDIAEGFDGFVEGEGAEYDVTGSQTLPGNSENEFTYSLKEGTLAANYIIETVFGTLTVKDREDPEDPDNPDPEKDKYNVTFTARSDEFTYDGKPHTVKGFVEENADGSLTWTNDKGVKFTITGISAEETQTNAGSYTVKVKGTAKVTDPEGNDVTDQFNIKPADGTLKINPAKIGEEEPLDPDDPQGGKRFEVSDPEDTVYNGEEQKKPVSVTDLLIGEGATKLVEGKDYTLSYSDDVTDVGTVTVTVIGKGNYVGTVVKTYEITPADLTLTSASDSKIYDGSPLTNDTVTVEGLANADKGKIEFSVTGSQTLVGQSDNTFEYKWADEEEFKTSALDTLKSYFVVYAADGDHKLADNYNVKVVYGTLNVTDDGADPDKVVTKTHEDRTYEVDDEIEFTIKATNIYDEVKTITLIEQDGVTLEQDVFENVAPGQTVETTAVYTVTEEDVEEGEFVNTVKARFSGDDEKEFTNNDKVTSFGEPDDGDDEPEEADEPDEPDNKDNGTKKSDKPNTGDNGFGFDLTMLFGSAAAFLAMLAGRRRREEE